MKHPIMNCWVIDVTILTDPLLDSKSFTKYVEDTLGVPGEANQETITKFMCLVESKVEYCK